MAITSAPKRRALALRPTGRRLAQVARELATPRTLLVGGALVIVGYLAVVPLVIPGILYAAAWIFLADPRIGLINVVLFEPILGHGLFNTFSMWGMIWVQGLHLAPIAFLLMGAAFRSIDQSLEEAATGPCCGRPPP